MNNKKFILAGVGTVLVVVLFGALFTFIVGSGAAPPNDLNLAISLLEQNRWDLAGRIARDLDKSGNIDKDADAAWNYVQGVSLTQSVSEQLTIPKNRQVLRIAIEHLEKSQKAGFPLGSKGRAQYYLGLAYFHTYQWPKAEALLNESVTNWPLHRSDALSMVVQAALRQQPPNIETARTCLKSWQSIPGLAAEELARIHLGEAELALATMDTEACERELLKIDPSLSAYSEANLVGGRWRLELAEKDPKSAQTQESLSVAADLLRKCLHSLHSSDEQRRQANYLLGRTFRSQKKFAEALGTFSGVRQRDPQSAEAIASGVEEAEILLQLEKFEACVNTIRHILRDIGNVRLYNERWLTVDRLRTKLLDIGRELREREDFQLAIDLASFFSPVFPPADSVRLQAEAYQHWADFLADRAPPTTGQDKSTTREQVSSKYLQAGARFEELSRLEMRSAEYPDIVWQAIHCFQRANDLPTANRMLVDYLRYEDRTKLPRGFLALGQNYLNSGEWQKAIVPLERCLKEYPDHPISYEARLLTARAYVEQNRLEEAIELLLQNLRDGSLEPSSEAWRNSLFQLGQTVFRRADRLILEAELAPQTDWANITKKLEESHDTFMEGVGELSEASMRWDDDPRYFETRYLIGKSYRMGAEFPSRILDSNRITVEAARRQLVQQRRTLLESSLAEFKALHTDLTAKQEVQGLTDQDKAILRNSYFGEADALFELGQFEEAILAYRNVGNRLLNQPEALEALIQIAQCQRSLGQNTMAQRTLAQAEQVLRRIPSEFDSKFAILTRSTRAEWQQLIAWMQTW